MNMKRLAVFSAVLMLLLGASFAAAQTPPPRSATHFSNPLLNEVVRMSNAGMRNETIIAYVRARQSRLEAELTADDLIELRRAGVDESVIQYLAGAASFAGGGSSDRDVRYSGESGEGETVAVDPGYTGRYYGGWGWGWGWPYSGWGWGWGWPYYGSVVIGGRFGHGGHWGHGGWGHGGGHGGGRGGHR